MLRALCLALLLVPGAAAAQTWFPVDADPRDRPGSGAHAPGGYSGMPPSPQLGDPKETLPRHRYDPAYPSRGLPGDDKGVPLMVLDAPPMHGKLLDRERVEALANPVPEVPFGDQGQWLSGTPYVVDGDSFGLNGELVRLAGIDAPEVDQLCYRGNIPHRCGIDARTFLADTIEDTRVDCRINYRDAADRLIATCWTQGRDLNALIARNGWALVWAGAPSPYSGMEEAARAAQQGVWAFDFRHPAEWRTIMDTERKTLDARMATGQDATTKPFPYVPFTERQNHSAPTPTYVIPPR